MKKNTQLYIVALMLFLGGIGYLLYSGISDGTAYFINVAEASAMSPEKLQAVRLSGMVKTEGIEKTDRPVGVRFFLQDINVPDKSVQVIYKGSIPDGFKPGAEVTVQGKWSTPDKAFTVHSMTTKCPSKYKKENRT